MINPILILVDNGNGNDFKIKYDTDYQELFVNHHIKMNNTSYLTDV